LKNFVQAGSNVTLTAPATVASGGVVIAGSIVGIAAGAAASGALVDVVVTGIFELPKVSAQAIGLGAPVYWDAATSLATAVSSGNTRLGTAVAAAANPSATVRVRLVSI